MSPEILLMSYVFLLGLVFGSFINVCIHRLPRGETLSGRSACPHCRHKINWHENIPVLSFIFLKGRCAHCKRPIGWRYPMVEGLTALLAMAVLVRTGFDLVASIIWFVFFIAPLIVIFFVDLKHRVIPDVISLPGIFAGFAVTIIFSWPAWKNALIFSSLGALAGGGSLFVLGYLYILIRKREGMGGGDVKLAAMLGAFLGWNAVIFIFLISSLMALIYAVIVMMILRKRESPLIIPYGPFLSTAALVFYFYGEEIIRFYFRG